MTELLTRQQYMRQYTPTPAGKALHRQYYAQFVDHRVINHVVGFIGADRILASTDPHFNDIDLKRWNMARPLYLPIKFKDVSDFPSDAGFVCIAKEAALQYVERTQADA